MSRKPITIVLADDDDGHASLIERNFIRAGLPNTLVRVRDGVEALEILRGEGKYSGQTLPQPVLLILDINMPRLDGIETLRRLKQDERLSSIPVIVLTTTDDPREIQRCYQEGCNVYISKPVAYDAFIETIQRLESFLEVMQLPGVVPAKIAA